MPDVRFDHIAIGMARMADAVPFVAGELGGVPQSGGPGGAFRFAAWGFAGGGVLEVIEPAGADGFLHRFLAKSGPGVHHVTFTVANLRATCDRAEAEGYGIVGYDDSDPDWKTAYLHPKQALGIVVQLAQPSGRSDPRPWAVPIGPASPPPPPPVTLLGLRLRAATRARAERQWEAVLGGSPTEGQADELIFRWPESPMVVTVETAAEGPEGPVAIELMTDRPLAIPPGRHPLLGARFVVRGR